MHLIYVSAANLRNNAKYFTCKYSLSDKGME